MSTVGGTRVPVGREDLLATLAGHAAAAAGGTGRLVFLGGEAGVGKTTVAAALMAQADAELRVRRGHCDSVTTPAPLGPLADAVPELADLLEDTELDPVRLFRRLRAELIGAPTLLVLEDVHWADEATLDLLRFLARRLVDVPLLIVATYRDDEAGGDHPLVRLRGDLATVPSVEQVAVEPLPVEAVAEVLAGAGADLDPVTVHRSTGGNPFFVTELLAVGGDRLPATVRDAVLARAARLSSDARRVLDAAAVLGPRTRLPLLLTVSGQAGRAVDECVARGMLVADGTGLSFRHELARRAIEEAIAPAARSDLHAAALAAGAGGELDDRRLAHHAVACGDRAAGRAYAIRAATRAARLGAHREAVQLYRVAIDAAAESDDAATASLRGMLAYECYLTDRTAEAHAEHLAALAVWQRLDDRAAMGRTRRWLSRLSWFLGRNDEAEEHGAEAVRVLEPLGPSADLAMAYSNLAQLRMLANDLAGTLEWGERAIALARSIGAREAEMHALNNVGTVLWADAERPEGRTQLVRSLELAVAADAHEHAARAYTNLAATAVLNRQYAEADVQLRAGIAYCDERDLDSWRTYLSAWRARSAAEQGRILEAQESAELVLRQPQASPVARIPAQVVVAELAARRGEDAAARLDEVARLAVASGELQRLAPVAAARAEVAWLTGRPTAAIEAAVDEAWPAALVHPRRWVLGELAWWLALAGRPRDPGVPIAEPFELMVDGRFADAADAWARLGSPLWRARALGLVPDLAAARDAFELADRIEAPALRAALIRERFARGLPVPRPQRASTQANAYGLTARELDVLALVAEGLTNAEVAQRLYLSEKTVGHHVSAVLRKTGESTRARAAAAFRNGAGGPT